MNLVSHRDALVGLLSAIAPTDSMTYQDREKIGTTKADGFCIALDSVDFSDPNDRTDVLTDTIKWTLDVYSERLDVDAETTCLGLLSQAMSALTHASIQGAEIILTGITRDTETQSTALYRLTFMYELTEDFNG